MNLSRILTVVCAALVLVTSGAYASGEWYWLVATNPETGTLHFTGRSGSASPLTLSAFVVNNDPAHQLVFDGITLKTDDLTPLDPGLFATLWTTNAMVEIPRAFTVPGSGRQDFALGTFDLASAAPGTYKLRFIAAVEYASVDANPDQANSAFVTIDVLPVPEPASALVLAVPFLGYAVLRRRGRSRK